MNRYHSHITSAVSILDSYNGATPLVHHLKKFFAAEKKYGSRDRKTISALCYGYFRLGHAKKGWKKNDRILAGLLLMVSAPDEMLQFLKPEWNDIAGSSIAEKLKLLDIDPVEIFPFYEQLSDKIDANKYAVSFCFQPHLYLRVRPGKHTAVLQKLDDAAIPYEMQGENCLQLQIGSKADAVLKLNREAVIQDISSQHVLDYFDKLQMPEKKPDAWDCCAASGGKSILLYDKLKGNVRITVSDIRESILINLKHRLDDAGISLNRSFVADLRKERPSSEENQFNIVLCDAPCTGSGTWGRSPEQLYYFNRKKSDAYVLLQKNIVLNAIPSLSGNGLFFYITCSVFKAENEDIVAYILENSKLQLFQMDYLEGYTRSADTLFVAVFSKR